MYIYNPCVIHKPLEYINFKLVYFSVDIADSVSNVYLSIALLKFYPYFCNWNCCLSSKYACDKIKLSKKSKEITTSWKTGQIVCHRERNIAPPPTFRPGMHSLLMYNSGVVNQAPSANQSLRYMYMC